jgi:hypothetical protein
LNSRSHSAPAAWSMQRATCWTITRPSTQWWFRYRAPTFSLTWTCTRTQQDDVESQFLDHSYFCTHF